MTECSLNVIKKTLRLFYYQNRLSSDYYKKNSYVPKKSHSNNWKTPIVDT